MSLLRNVCKLFSIAKLHTQLRHKYVGSGFPFMAVASDVEIHITASK